MPAFLDELKREYPNNSGAVFGTMNKLGVMHGNKETAKGRAMQAKHDAKPMATGGAIVPWWEQQQPMPPMPGTEMQDPQQPTWMPPQPQDRWMPDEIQGGPPDLQQQTLGVAPPDDTNATPQNGFNPGPDTTAEDEAANGPSGPPEAGISPPATPRQQEASSATDMGNPGALSRGAASATPAPLAEDPRITRSKENLAAIAADAKKPVPAWRQALGAALTLSPRTQGISQMVLHPPDKAKEAANILLKGSAEARLDEKAKQDAEIHKLTAESLNTQRQSLAETREATAEWRKQNAETFRQRVQEMASERNRKFIQDRLKGREQDSSYQKESDQRVPNSEWIPDPEKAGYGWMAPPAYSPLPAELAKYVPGSQVGEMISHTERQNAMKVANQILLEESKNENKNVLDAPTRTALASFGGDPKNNKDITRARQLVQSDSIATARAKQKPREAPQELWMVPDGKGGFTAKTITEGSAIPAGSLKGSGVNTSNLPTAQNRARAEFAKTVTDRVPDLLGQIDALKDKIGPGAGRWEQMWVNKGGMNDPEFAGLDQDLKMYASAVVVTHFGARGGGHEYREALEKNFGEAQSPEDLKARIQHADKWIQGYANIGKPKGSPQGGGSTRFSSNGQIYNIPVSNQAEFLKDHPNATPAP